MIAVSMEQADAIYVARWAESDESRVCLAAESPPTVRKARSADHS